LVSDPTRHADAQLAILHVDLTETPKEYLDAARRYPRALNLEVTDISKTLVSRQLVQRGDGYTGAVMVKSNRNCGGIQELVLSKRGAPPSREEIQRLLSYRVFPTPNQVPDSVWRDDHWVVERFLPERKGEYFCLRTWVFLGDRETNSLCYSKSPVVKSHNIVLREDVREVPEALRQRREELGFDFGKFDYAIVDGEVVLYDANRTPTLGAFPREQVAARFGPLAEGIEQYL
jgi:hypothetical protein